MSSEGRTEGANGGARTGGGGFQLKFSNDVCKLQQKHRPGSWAHRWEGKHHGHHIVNRRQTGLEGSGVPGEPQERGGRQGREEAGGGTGWLWGAPRPPPCLSGCTVRGSATTGAGLGLSNTEAA